MISRRASARHHGERYVGAALEAVLTQMFGDFELVISDLTCHSLLTVGRYSV